MEKITILHLNNMILCLNLTISCDGTHEWNALVCQSVLANYVTIRNILFFCYKAVSKSTYMYCELDIINLTVELDKQKNFSNFT